MENKKPSSQPEYVTRDEFLKETREIKNSISGLDTKFGSLDTKVSSLDTKVTSLDTKVSSLDTKVKSLDTKVELNTNAIGKLAFEIIGVKDRLAGMDYKLDHDVMSKADGQKILEHLDIVIQKI